MKLIITNVLALFLSLFSLAQEKNIETESITIDNLISFIVEHYNTEANADASRHITFLVETYAPHFNTEDSVILKQGFKLLSKRLSETDLVSIVTYANFNGIALNKAEATDLNKIMYVLEHPKASVKTFEEDGIETAYNFAKNNFEEAAENTVIMIRMLYKKAQVNTTETNKNSSKEKVKNNAVVLTAMALLPEIIAVIKD